MKRTFILPVLAVLAAALVFTSCKPSRVWATKERAPRERERRVYDEPAPARYYATVSLIVRPTPGFVMRQSPNGRYYHRSQQGYLYWKGYDNRFYLDKAELRNVRYNRWEYEEWKRYSRQSR